jgi:glycosyltransferase involved in cell wall biosynthesis
MHPRHSVIIITYNQEKLIGRALDSVLSQKEHLFEIVVCDDCSTDKNWEVIQDYHRKYPDLIKPYCNPYNFGIFGNIESSWSKPSGDVIWYLSGDDEYCNGLFENANALIAENNIDLGNELFTLYFDWKSIDLDGNEKFFSNALIMKHNSISLKLRGLICNRTTGISKNVIDKFFPVRKDIGIFADGLIDIQTQLFSNKNYYSSFVGSIYYTGLGIGSRTNHLERLNSYLILWDEFDKILKNISSTDKSWIKYQKFKTHFLLQKSLISFYNYFKYYIKSIELKFGIKTIVIGFLQLNYSIIKPLKHS